MNENPDSTKTTLSEVEKLSERWDAIVYNAQGSPLEDLTINCLAKNTANQRRWSRPGAKVKNDTLARYIYLSFEELIEIEKLDLKTATLLLEICEGTMLFVHESSKLNNMSDIEEEASSQRMRFVEEYGLYQDYPIALSNLDIHLRELCEAEEVITFIDLMSFLDGLSDKAWLGGSYRDLQNVFAHGDEKGLCQYFPYRIGHRGFHLPESLAFCLYRLNKRELESLDEYQEQRRKKSRFGSKQIEMPSVVEKKLLPQFFQCMHYFGQRQQNLVVNLYDSSYVTRELMFIHDPKIEDTLNWLLRLALGVFRPSEIPKVDEELKTISLNTDNKLHRELKILLEGA